MFGLTCLAGGLGVVAAAMMCVIIIQARRIDDLRTACRAHEFVLDRLNHELGLLVKARPVKPATDAGRTESPKDSH